MNDDLLSVSFPDSLILQVPYSVFEGDTLVLRCHRRRKEKLTAVKYTWNGKILPNFNKSWDLLIPNASSNNNGNYQCFGYGDNNDVFRSNFKMIKIQGESFSSYRFA